MQTVEMQPLGPNDHQLVGGTGLEPWVTPRGIEGRMVDHEAQPITFITVWLMPWDQIDRARRDIAEGRREPPYVRFAPGASDEPGWTKYIPGGPLKPDG